MSIKILSSNQFTECAEIVDIYGQGFNYPTKRGVDGFEIHFDVEATNKMCKTRQFYIIYQSSERKDNMMAYSGYEMSPASFYGLDGDQSELLEEFLGESDNLLKAEAQKMCKDWLEQYK